MGFKNKICVCVCVCLDGGVLVGQRGALQKQFGNHLLRLICICVCTNSHLMILYLQPVKQKRCTSLKQAD